MHFSLNQIRRLIDQAALEPSTGDKWLDDRYLEDIPIIGHTNPYYKWFWLIAKTCRPAFSVELGSWRATAAAHLADGSPTGKVITIDIHKDPGQEIDQRKAREAEAYYPNLTYVNAWTRDAVPVVKAWGRPIDFLYIDAWHEYKWAIEEWQLYSPLLADQALVICDDIFDSAGTTEGMLKFWSEISAPYDNFINTGMHSWIPMGVFKFDRV